MIGHELKPGEVVRFTSTGQIGVCGKVLPSVANVWMLDWIGRNPPVFISRMCALESLTWIHPTDCGLEVAPASVRISWRNRFAAALRAIKGEF